MKDPEKTTFFDRLHQGMRDSIAYSKARLRSLTTKKRNPSSESQQCRVRTLTRPFGPPSP